MGILRSIKKLFADPRHVTRLEELEAGEVIVDGAVRLGEGGPLVSPIKGQACVAFFYTASHRSPGRQAALVERPLKTAEGFTSFELELDDGGRLEAVPRVSDRFTREDHQKLASAGYPGFQAAEQVVPARARVRARGVAKQKGDGWVLTYRKLELLKTESSAKKAGTAAKKPAPAAAVKKPGKRKG